MDNNNPPQAATAAETFAALQAECRQWQEDMKTLANSDDLFKVRTANTWLQDASTRAVPKMLFGRFWYEGELCILFADSNLGKSILAMQIANSINCHEAITPFELEAERQPILFYDFELTDKQMEARYSNEFKDHYQFRD
ncbi:MAG: AAA family ATPase, partial [Bacteroidota bacterium]